MSDEGTFHIDLSSIGAEALEADDPPKIGAFPLHAVLGTGGMGRVYLGVTPDGYAAVKQVLPYLANDRNFLRHFGQELDNQARLPAGISARLLAADRTARPPWFATEYVPGVTLHDAVYYNNGPLPPAVVWTLLRELADRLSRIARLEMVHRDLKPSNVMLTDDGCRLIDFGIARAVEQSSLTTTGKVLGTPAYMSPEQATAVRDLTPAADVFSLAGVLVFAATGQPPFGASSGTDVLYRIVHQEPDLADLRALDPRLAEIIESCLAKRPEDRPSAAALAELAAARAMTESGAPIWPQAVASVIAARRAFADGPRDEPEPGPDAESGPDATEWERDYAEPEVSDGVAQSKEMAALSLVSEPSAPPSGPSDALKSESSDASVLVRHQPWRSRKAMLILAALLLIAGTAGTLVALNKVPFVTSAKSGATGGESQALAGSTGSTGASPTSSASGSATHTNSAKPTRSGTASQGATSQRTGSVSAGSGADNSTTSETSAPAATHASTGSGGGGSSSDPTVVSTSYGELKNVASGVCVSGQAGAGTQACDLSTTVLWHEVAVSGGFDFVNDQTSLCLMNNEASGYDAYAFSCSWNASIETWTIGTRTSQGGTLTNSGECLSYSSTATGHLDMAACNPSDADQLWYDAGS